VKLGDGVTLGNWVKLGDEVKLGDGVTLGNWVKLGDGVKLGNGVTLGNGVKLGDGVTLGDEVKLGDGVKLGDWVKLGDGVTLGNWVTLGDGVTLGDRVKWNTSPLTVQGSRHLAVNTAPGIIQIGCQTHSFEHWQEHVLGIAKMHGYTKKQAEEYKRIVEFIVANGVAGKVAQ